MARSQNPRSGSSDGGSQQTMTSRLQQMRKQAEQNLSEGAVTPAYKANREEILDLLNRALAGEWTAFLQYWHHYTMASDIHSPGIRDVWKEHANQEYEHAQQINERIDQLGGVPANSPKRIDQLSPMPFTEGHDMQSMLQEDLIAERAAIELYNEIVRRCGFDDNETRTLFEGILLVEAEHASELANFLFQVDASTGEQIPALHQTGLEKPGKQYRAAS